MFLSIAMIVKDEEKNIEACLKAIEVLKSQIDMEIIIVDTGSIDSTVAIAKKYTDKIYFHKWENDFAKMRNIAIGYCSGEWILVLDADEELTNPWELINFFSNIDCLEYNSATVNIKSSNREDDDSVYSITPIIRLFRNTRKFKYIGKIHEQPSNCTPTCTTLIEFNHKGYYLNDYKLRIKKFNRNSKLLLKQLEENKNDIYTYYQLYSTFLMFNDNEKAIEYLLKAEELVRKTSSADKYLYVLLGKANELYKSGDYIRASYQYEEILKICPYHIDTIYVLIQCYIQKNEISKAELFIDEYFNRIDDKTTWIKMKGLGIESQFYNKKDELLDIKVKILYQREEYEHIIDIYNKETDIKNKILWMVIFINSCIKARDYTRLAENLNELIDYNNDLANEIIITLDKLLLFEPPETKKNILHIIGDKNTILNRYINLIYNQEIKFDLIKKINFDKYSDVKASIIRKMINKKIDIFKILEKLQESNIEKYLNYLCNYYEAIKILNDYSEELICIFDYDKLKLQKQIDFSLLNCDKVSDEDKVTIAFRTLMNNEYYIKSDKYEEDEFSAALHELYVDIGKMNEDSLKYIRNIKKIIEQGYIPSQISKSIIRFISDIQDEPIIKSVESERKHIINTVIELINSEKEENWIEAKNILSEMKKVLKYDYSIYNLLGVVDFAQGKIQAALYNFNMAIMFNPEDYESIYSMGQIMGEKNKKNESLFFFNLLLNNCKDKSLIDICKNTMLNFCLCESNPYTLIDEESYDRYCREEGGKNEYFRFD